MALPFVISGGIHITVKGDATPTANVLVLLIGAVVSNLLGTTGASMLLIRPWLRMNKYRLTAHHVVFFIFIVSNVGGSLTPVGDPPLFLGFLKGVPFWWVVQNCWLMWLAGVGILLAMFFVVDRHNFLRAPKEVRQRETAHEQWRVEGFAELVFPALVPGSLLIHHSPVLREALMVAAAAGSYFTTQKAVHESNDFNFAPIKEVAILFAGIFATMIPALDWLQANAASLGQPGPSLFFWGSGALSSELDNAPTYLSFLSTAYGAFVPTDLTAEIMSYIKAHGTDLAAIGAGPHAEQIRQAVIALRVHFPAGIDASHLAPEQVQMALMLHQPFYATCLKAISIGSVFFGANPYIGHEPNFMSKAIADQQKAHTPTFLLYVFKFTLPFMSPMLDIALILFFP